MFFVINKQSVIMIISVIVGFGLLLLCGEFNKNQNVAKETFAAPVANKIIVIDPGHGGFDGGASDNAVQEKEVNLDVAMRLKEYVEQAGGIAIMTRVEDVSTADKNMDGKSAKKSDLQARKELVDESEADIFISIHMNKFIMPQYKGAQVFYGGSENSKELGETIQETMKEILNDGNTRVAKKSDGNIYILKNTTVPSVIIECGFLSNIQEAELLKKDEYKQKLAWSIYIGITKFFGNTGI